MLASAVLDPGACSTDDAALLSILELLNWLLTNLSKGMLPTSSFTLSLYCSLFMFKKWLTESLGADS
jgi:hypothetical protein